jgi:hypothetical protein
VELLPLSDETSSHVDESLAVTQVNVYLSNTSFLKVGNDIIYAGEPVTKKVKCYLSNRWSGDGKLSFSDGARGTFWQLNNAGRTVGGCQHRPCGDEIYTCNRGFEHSGRSGSGTVGKK